VSAPDPALLPAGRLFHGHYEIVRCINSGAMGSVYEVLDHKTRRRRALKVMLPNLIADPELRARFRLEATITADIISEHIVETFDADVDAETGSPFLVMELLRGEDLATMLTHRGRLPAEEVVLLLSQAARALDKTHAAGIIHRDLKPENLFVTYRDDGSPRVKVLDFGIAKVTAQSAVKTTRSIGTPPYMSPEQISGEGVDPRSDLYALAHIAFALLVGQPYWLEEAKATEAVYPLLLKIVQGAKEPAGPRARRLGVTLPPGFEAWFTKATALSPEQRYSSARELVTTLALALGVSVPVAALSASAGDWSLVADRAAVLAALKAPPKGSASPSAPPGLPLVMPPNPGANVGSVPPSSASGPPPPLTPNAPGFPQGPSFGSAPPRPSFGMTPPPPPPSYPVGPNPYPSQPPGTPAPPTFGMPPPQAYPTPPHLAMPPGMMPRPAHGANATASDLTATIPFGRPRRVARWLIAGAVVALMGVGAIAYIVIFRPGSSSQAAPKVEIAQPPPLLSITPEPLLPPSASPSGSPSASPTTSSSAAGAVPTSSTSPTSSSAPAPVYGRPFRPTTTPKKPGSRGGPSYDPLRDL
jgi:serine/threonine-protein kinase